jgi:hypothetical protein
MITTLARAADASIRSEKSKEPFISLEGALDNLCALLKDEQISIDMISRTN